MSATTSVFPHTCEAWQPEPEETSPLQPSSSSRNQEFFFVEFYVSHVYLLSEVGDSAIIRTTYKSFRQERDHLVHDATSWSSISNMLSQVDVPFHAQPVMIAKISETARSISAGNRDLRILPMVVSISLVVRGSEEVPDGLYGGNPVPASRTAIEALQRVEAGGSSGEDFCVICLDKIGDGSGPVQMPCKHVYHGDCIVGWLRRSNFCPLCRFQLPTS